VSSSFGARQLDRPELTPNRSHSTQPQAIISIIFGEYLCRLLYHTAFSADPNVAARSVS
jgi:hypothetical protein